MASSNPLRSDKKYLKDLAEYCSSYLKIAGIGSYDNESSKAHALHFAGYFAFYSSKKYLLGQIVSAPKQGLTNS
jgi:hypothetical protein